MFSEHHIYYKIRLTNYKKDGLINTRENKL